MNVLRHLLLTLALLLSAVGLSVAATSANSPSDMQHMQTMQGASSMHGCCDMEMHACCEDSQTCTHSCASVHCAAPMGLSVQMAGIVIYAPRFQQSVLEPIVSLSQRFYPPLTPPPLV